MAKISIIIPSRNEKYLKKTIDDIYAKATGDFEVIVGLNGRTDFEIPPKMPNLTIIKLDEPIGLKSMINYLVKQATGKYIYKSDAHCMFGKGFDEILQSEMQDNWIVTPRFYVLDAEAWRVQDERFYDYFYLCCPFTDPRGIRFKAGGHWPQRTQERLPYQEDGELKLDPYNDYPLVDETPSMHGSGWFISKEYFNYLGGFPEADIMGHAQEPIWLGLKAWLDGGKLMVNKRTWYAHLHQDSKDRGYPEDRKATENTYKWTADYWLTDSWTGRKHNFDWFVEKFMPMPTWPENWKKLYDNYKK